MGVLLKLKNENNKGGICEKRKYEIIKVLMSFKKFYGD